jgi:hypothetical protein
LQIPHDALCSLVDVGFRYPEGLHAFIEEVRGVGATRATRSLRVSVLIRKSAATRSISLLLRALNSSCVRHQSRTRPSKTRTASCPVIAASIRFRTNILCIGLICSFDLDQRRRARAMYSDVVTVRAELSGPSRVAFLGTPMRWRRALTRINSYGGRMPPRLIEPHRHIKLADGTRVAPRRLARLGWAAR